MRIIYFLLSSVLIFEIVPKSEELFTSFFGAKLQFDEGEPLDSMMLHCQERNEIAFLEVSSYINQDSAFVNSVVGNSLIEMSEYNVVVLIVDLYHNSGQITVAIAFNQLNEQFLGSFHVKEIWDESGEQTSFSLDYRRSGNVFELYSQSGREIDTTRLQVNSDGIYFIGSD